MLIPIYVWYIYLILCVVEMCKYIDTKSAIDEYVKPFAVTP